MENWIPQHAIKSRNNENDNMENSIYHDNKIVKARYTHKVNKYDYSELICTFKDGSEKIFKFHAGNPMPKEYAVVGLTWEQLQGVYVGMFRMALGEFIKISEQN